MENTIARLEELRARKVSKPEDAEAAAEAARLLAEALRIKERAERLLSRSEQREWTRDVSSGGLSGLTLHEAARRVLEQAGTPLHAKELGARIKSGGWRHPRSSRAHDDQIVFQLAARLPRLPEVFRRVGPNTFALAEWGDDPFRKRGKKPRFPLFEGPGEAVGRKIAQSHEHVTSPRSQWRSS